MSKIKVGEKFYIEVEVVDSLNNGGVMVSVNNFTLLIAKVSELIPHSKLMEIPEIWKKYEFSRDAKNWNKGEFVGFGKYCESIKTTSIVDYIRPIQQPNELEELQQKAKELGYKLVKKIKYLTFCVFI